MRSDRNQAPYLCLPLLTIVVFPASPDMRAKCFGHTQVQEPSGWGPACRPLQLLSVPFSWTPPPHSPITVPSSPTSTSWFMLCSAWMSSCEAFEVSLRLLPWNPTCSFSLPWTEHPLCSEASYGQAPVLPQRLTLAGGWGLQGSCPEVVGMNWGKRYVHGKAGISGWGRKSEVVTESYPFPTPR